MKLVEAPSREQLLAFCAADPIERVFLEDVARRGLGRFLGAADHGTLVGICHVGANVVPSGRGSELYARATERAQPRMIIGDESAVADLWEAVARKLPRPREDRPGQPVYALEEPPEAGETGLRLATASDLELLLPACARAHEEELGIDPLKRDAQGFRWRTQAQIEEGRSWLWEVDGVIRFKAEASAWTPRAVQLQQVWADPAARGRGFATRALQDLCRMLLADTPVVCLFVRPENAPAIRLYDRVGMHRVGAFRSLVF